MTQNQYDEILKLYDDYIVFVDTKNKKIELALDGDNELCKDIGYIEFAKIFTTAGNFDDESKGKMERFLTNLNINDDSTFKFQANYKTVTGEKVPLTVKGKKINDNNIVLSFSSEHFLGSKKIDDLTRILSKDSVIKIAQTYIEKQEPFILFLFDIDYFASFNDKYGNIFGDVLLVETAAALKRIIKPNGYVARESGDRFLILLKVKNDFDYIYNTVTSLRKQAMSLISNNIKQAQITATIGCTIFPKDGQDFDTLYKKSYLALQRGKKKGRNCFIIYFEDKCGTIDNYNIPISQFDSYSNVATNFNIVSGIYEIINREGSKDKNINDALSLIGSYFLLERVNFFILNPDLNKTMKVHQWHSPLIEPKKIITSKERFDKWHQSFDNMGMVKFIQIDGNKNLPVYNILKEDEVSALLAFNLKYNDIEVGLIRFEMTTSNKFWNQNDVSALHLISKLFAIYLYKEYQATLFEKKLSYDRLTNIYNYSKWTNAVYEYLDDHNYDPNYSIVSFGYENYLHKVDTLGSQAVNEALIFTAKALAAIATDEIYSRTTEDRFIVFVPNTNKKEIESNLNKLYKYVITNFKYGHHFKIRAGVCIHEGNDTLNNTIDKSGLTRQKANELGVVTLFYTDSIYENYRLKRELEIHQDIALKNGEFKLYLQPKIDTTTNTIAGAEALSRWNFKNERLLSPDKFIPLFEENGFINDLDLNVFENVCKFQRKVLDLGYEPVIISVNLSMYQKNFDEYPANINKIRKKYGIPAKYLEIEITESTYVKNVNNVIELMRKLHKDGYKVSMDDFGTGYSNLASLATFDFDTVKLDKNFCTNIEGEKERLILTFVVQLAKKLNINVLCEGVETEKVVEFLKNIGCTLIQGFYFDKPMPADQMMEKYLKK